MRRNEEEERTARTHERRKTKRVGKGSQSEANRRAPQGERKFHLSGVRAVLDEIAEGAVDGRAEDGQGTAEPGIENGTAVAPGEPAPGEGRPTPGTERQTAGALWIVWDTSKLRKHRVILRAGKTDMVPVAQPAVNEGESEPATIRRILEKRSASGTEDTALMELSEPFS
jgi:hypothetical protein